ncbi:transcription/translation regulatory transformer protein RfaH [Pseudomonas sp. ZM23]|uniref:Transcription/translation regulatory transformer protein RfaH n=1 Tax=Pseudomonas triclosanedens TaxID=2961893 RepID=A0ABY6ZXA5_9PSED|nr:transcription/translation regulatory transformer protein RfaH [Pseudomonas triclosanedens]MCP8466861.1 transcription/translation regulatory transformer protein RfaH [Pseudomonas triclosanedens]MCP8470085.1 transcription/translation regulatory transformer protein RfaH [Pseudomonas triclosanedens]MCP8477995.1 transcription/translation regulatory transformer protein RfaH [Pseudomonas triclosanedens]WAI49409.1 transcription/translation regulatory transformer protein RfaH [Pseudomonas triclosaned
MSATEPLHRWYLIQTKPHQELRAEENLARQGFACYRPVVGQGARPQPLFPGYLFIRLDQQHDNWFPIRSTRGVSRIVSFGPQPLPVADELVEDIRRRLLALPERPASRFQHGQTVRVRCAGACEVDAIFLCDDGAERALILLNLLQREQRVRVPLSRLSAADGEGWRA